MQEKKCLGCKEIKPLSKFGTRRASYDGKTTRCLKCMAKQQRERQKNKAGRTARSRKHAGSPMDEQFGNSRVLLSRPIL